MKVVAPVTRAGIEQPVPAAAKPAVPAGFGQSCGLSKRAREIPGAVHRRQGFAGVRVGRTPARSTGNPTGAGIEQPVPAILVQGFAGKNGAHSPAAAAKNHAGGMEQFDGFPQEFLVFHIEMWKVK